LVQSLVQVFGDEFRANVGGACQLPRSLQFHKIVDWIAETGRFAYAEEYTSR